MNRPFTDDQIEFMRADLKCNMGLTKMIEAVKAYATVGEITQIIKAVYGEYEEKIYF